MTLNELVMESGYRFPYKGLLTPRKLENGHRNRVAELDRNEHSHIWSCGLLVLALSRASTYLR